MVKRQLQEANVLQQAKLHVSTTRRCSSLGSSRSACSRWPTRSRARSGLVIDTPVGAVVHTGDYKLDETPAGGRTTDLARLRKLTPNGVLALLGDSTNADRPGRTPTEQAVAAELDRLFAETKDGRIIIATFASLLDRLQAIMLLAKKHGRKVALTGRSLEKNVALARELGYLKVPKGLLVDADAKVPDKQLVHPGHRLARRAALGAEPHGAGRAPPGAGEAGRYHHHLRRHHPRQRGRSRPDAQQAVWVGRERDLRPAGRRCTCRATAAATR